MKTTPIRLLIAEDHAIVRQGLAAMLHRIEGFEVVGEAANGLEAVRLCAELRPEVLLLDLRMPVLDGLGTLQAIRTRSFQPAVIILTTFDTDEGIYQALAAGARAYLLKDATIEELAECIREVHAGRTVLKPALEARLASRGVAPNLTPREMDVLRLIADGRSNKEIGVHLTISETTVKSHATSILQKLGAAGRTEAIAFAVKRGLLAMN